MERDELIALGAGVVAGAWLYTRFGRRGPGEPEVTPLPPGPDSAGVLQVLKEKLEANEIPLPLYSAGVDLLASGEVNPSTVLDWVARMSMVVPPTEPVAVPVVLPPVVEILPPPPPAVLEPMCRTTQDCIEKFGPGFICVDGRCEYMGVPPEDEEPIYVDLGSDMVFPEDVPGRYAPKDSALPQDVPVVLFGSRPTGMLDVTAEMGCC